MRNLLFPGRHHLLTNFQLEYLTRVTSGDRALLRDTRGNHVELNEPIQTLLWAVTSANHSNTRRNPLPAHRREVAIEEFATQLDVDSYVFLIDDLGFTERFAEYLLKKIDVDSLGRFSLTPENTLVASSTPEVIAQYERLGYRVLPVELLDREKVSFVADPPWEVMNKIIADGLRGEDWKTNSYFIGKVARATRRLYLKYAYGDQIIALHRSPLLTEDGDLTATRDYNTYVRSFDSGASRKLSLVREFIQPGRIVDIGCCTGALLRELTFEPKLRESDFYGIEVARPLYAECLHRKEQGLFGAENVFFYQKDFAAGQLFASNSINTFTTFALTHEIESYSGRDALESFIRSLYAQLAIGGCWINVDVVGPRDKTKRVLLKLRNDDGTKENQGKDPDIDRRFDPDDRQGLKSFLDGLSTFDRFLRFARDFRRDEGFQLPYEIVQRGEERYVALTLQNACEFLSKKDYTDNWSSEMHETFCFWDFPEWLSAVQNAGFRVVEGSNDYANPWIIENRYRNKVELYDEAMQPLEYPATNMILVAIKAQ
jgi:hypothetical protein